MSQKRPSDLPITLRDAIEEYSYAISGLATKTKRWYTYKLRFFVTWCEQYGHTNLDQITPSVVRRYLEHLRVTPSLETGKLLSDYSIHGAIQVIKGFLTWCAREDGLDEIISEKAVKRIAMPGVEEKTITIFTPQEVQALFAACAKERDELLVVRDRAILSVLFDTGARASELFFDTTRDEEREPTGLRMECVFLPSANSRYARRKPELGYLKFLGKGRKEREVGLGVEASQYLHRYISRYRKPADSRCPYVFLNQHGGPFTLHGAEAMLKRLASWARLDLSDCRLHKYRHTFAVNYLLNGGDLYRLMRLLGHTELSTTQLYLRAVEQRQAREGGKSVLDQLKSSQ